MQHTFYHSSRRTSGLGDHLLDPLEVPEVQELWWKGNVVVSRTGTTCVSYGS